MNHRSQSLAKRLRSLFIFLCITNLFGFISGEPNSKQADWIKSDSTNRFITQRSTARISSPNAFGHLFQNNTNTCHMDRSQPPALERLVKCRASSMFNFWRPKARLIGPRGWMNDPMGIFETKNGSFHIGYQCSPNHLGWANISQCSALTTDFVRFKDYNSWKNPVTLFPSQIYDIAGVFDGVVIKDGWNGHPSILYTSVFGGNFAPRCEPPEVEGVETQSIAYTKDDGSTWTKLDFGETGNPIIYHWPEKNLSGFRDPFVFESQEFSEFYSKKESIHHLSGDSNSQAPAGDKYLLLSGGIRNKGDPMKEGPRTFLYRQNKKNNIQDWTYLGPILSFPAEYNQTSEWTGGNGINFECGSFSKIDEKGPVQLQNSSIYSNQLNIFTIGTIGARNQTHMDDWPVWHAVSWDYSSPDGNVKGKVDFSGIIDWGHAYAFAQFPSKTKQLIVGWTYEDDEFNVLTRQRGSQGAFTLFREMFVKVTQNIHPSALDFQEKYPSWTTREEKDGSHSIITLGQKILPQIIESFYNHSQVTKMKDFSLNLSSESKQNGQNVKTKLLEFETQPKDRYYVISAQLDFFNKQNDPDQEPRHHSSTLCGGFRILSSAHEWTDVYYDPQEEYLFIDRSHSSAIPSYGKSTEKAKHRLWPIWNPTTNQVKYEKLNLTIIVDNSVLEVHANECTIITTRVYPWYQDSIKIKYFVQDSKNKLGVDDPKEISNDEYQDLEQINFSGIGNFHKSVHFSNVELWDGLLNAWPDRPHDTSCPFVSGHNITKSLYGLWPDL